MDNELKQYLEAMESRLRENTEAVEARLREHTEVVETRLLGEFWKWARTTDARYRQHQGTVTTLDERVSLVEDRIAAIESQGRA
jgi:hypothetical protein